MSRRTEAEYDVLVAGGGAGGVGAALGAARAGAKVCLVEKYGFLGGAATTSQVLAYCGFFQQGEAPAQAVGGAGELVLDELRRLGMDGKPHMSETTGNWIILLNPEGLKLALDRVLEAHGVDVLLHTRVAAATRTADRIEAATLAGMEGRRRVVAEGFVDATGDANLSLVSGVPMRVGDGEGALQAVSAPIRVGGIDPDLKIDREAVKTAIARYNETGAFPIARTDGGIYTRVPGTGEMWWMVIDLPLPDLTSASFTHAERTARKMAHDYVEILQGGVPGFERAFLAQTGPQIGIRETRHPAARYEMTAEDILSGRQREDGVARAAWPVELHGAAGKPVYHSIGGPGFASIPLDALRAKGLDNLYLAGRVIGADPIAYGSTRVMGTAFATGEAAGIAAAAGLTDGAEVAGRVRELGGLT
ncbi:FAD-dependent oxidoreductase [Tranquillimonas alkanivorans]|uniref:FAD dependent oxidoreductase n=1 Tax=Tranquillimonas alkanivorans TaxID=441119 RepID=A0A1I5T311_9RHOB|nr:FAD-dependent oxidoreductase [Tranquillimonas alkanivorans]SFP77358.1 FAD dependent oxidoreductase [Tranquillimonas alkanivorans]